MKLLSVTLDRSATRLFDRCRESYRTQSRLDLAQPLSVLQARLTSVQARLAAQPEARPELNNLVDRLEQLIEQAAQEEQRLTEAAAAPQHFEVQPSAGTIG